MVFGDTTQLHHLPLEFWALAGLAVIADVRPFPAALSVRRFAPIFISVCFTFAIMLVWGVGLAIAVQTIALGGAALRLRMDLERALFLVGRYALSFIAARAVLHLLKAELFQIGQPMSVTNGFELFSAAAAFFAVNYGALLLWLRFRHHGSWRQVFTRALGYQVLSTGALLVLAPLLVGAPTGWSILLVLVPVVAVNQLAWLYNQQDQQLRHDPLTGLLSRRAIVAEVEELGATYRPTAPADENRHFALFLLDLDRFKQVNDALGHAVGDRLLAVVADRLTAAVRRTDLVARLGGDEFAVVAPHMAEVSAARALASHIVEALAAPAELDGQSLYISASIGVALYPEHGADYATLMRHADVAMYEAKHHGEPVAIYSPESDHSSPRRLSLVADLRQALEEPAHQHEITFAYQPQIGIKTGEVVGVEALLRWRRPNRGLVNVEEAIQAAEHSPVIRQLTRRVVDDVVAQLGRWNSIGLTQRASINVSVRDLDAPDLVEYVATTLRRHRVRAEQLQVEITETALMSDPGAVQVTLRDLARLGVALSLDDFGTGYSSLAHLRRLPVTEVKIDRMFINRMAGDPDDYAIVRSIIDLAGALGLRVVAEGVEDQVTCQLLADAGCDVAQGWHYARPMPVVKLEEWLSRHHPSGCDHLAPETP